MLVFWMILFAVMIVIEVITIGLTTVWFGIGALGASIATFLGCGIGWQIGIFIVLSLVSMLVCRPLAMRFLNHAKEKTNIDDMIDKTAIVMEEINNEKAMGRVALNGMDWTARSEEGNIIEKDSHVTVVRVEGVKLIVK